MGMDETRADDAAVKNPHSDANGSNGTPSPETETVTIPVGEFEQFKLVVSQAQEYLENWKRERADFANYKRRIERETKETYQNAATDVLNSFLPIVDDFERALANVPAEMQGSPWLDGTSAIFRKLNKVLDEYGVTVVDPTGQPFDPNHHQAISVDEVSELPSGTVTETLQKGYRADERTLRPAFVKVSK